MGAMTPGYQQQERRAISLDSRQPTWAEAFFVSALDHKLARQYPRRRSKMNMMELDGLGQDVGSLFGIDGLKEDLLDVAVMGVSAGGAVVVGELLFEKIPFLKTMNPWLKATSAVALGAVGGIAAGRLVNKAVGAGVAAGLVGWGVSKAIQKVAGLTEASLGQYDDDDTLFGLGQDDSDLLLGLGQSENVSVEDFRPLPGQTSGLAQAGDVDAMDLQPLPGGGYISGVGSFLS